MKSSQYHLFAAVAVVSLAVACHKDKAPMAYGGGPGLQANIDNGIARIASAKCDRAARCNHIMPGKKYDSRDQCEAVIRGKLTDDIRLKDCRGGIDDSELQDCIKEVQEESCGNPIEKLTSHTECRVSKICFN
jgi:hypothetical protein